MLRLRNFLLISLVIGLGACGGSSGPETGTLTLAITDDGLYDWDQALIVLNSVTLIGQGGQETEMLDEPQTVDLFKLRNVSEFLAKQTLTARRISKIRLGIAELTLNKVDPVSGLVTETASPPTPTRKIDLLPQGPVEIRPGENVILTIDFYVPGSVHQTGNGQWRFRPVVFAKVGGDGFARLYGDYTTDSSGTSVCNLERVSDADLDIGFDVLEICVPLDETNASYFDQDGLPLLSVEDGDKISVYGYFDDAGETVLVEIIAKGTGTRGEAFTTLNGVVTEGWNILSQQFGLMLANQTPVTVELSDGAKVFEVEDDGTVTHAATVPADETALNEVVALGQRIEARGAYDDSTDPDTLQGFIAFAAGIADTTSGEIADDPTPVGEGEQFQFPLTPDVLTDPACVRTDPTTRIFDLSVNGDVIELTPIDVLELAMGDIINATGELIDGCLAADMVVRDQTTP